jgi:hypothetical protein
VNNGGTYEIGSEPTPTCSVVDAEDTGESATPDVDDSALSHRLGTVIVTCSYTDSDGLEGSDSVSYTVVDTGDPTASHQLSAAANGNGWHKADFTVTLNGSDSGGSGVQEIRYTIDGGTEQVAAGASTVLNINTEGVKTISYYSVDWAGNASAVDSVTVKLDKHAPSVAYQSASPAPNGAGWNKTNVTATFEATDTLSGMGASDTNQTATGTTLASTEGTNVTVGSPAFTDRAGNTAAAGTATSAGFNIDKTPPSVIVTGVSNGATYNLGSVPAAGCSTQDQNLLSGVKTNASLTVTGGPVDSVTATCSGAEDNAGNTNSASATYKVVYGRDGGILQPINPDNTSIFSRGKAVPVKFKLAGDAPNGFDYSKWTLSKVPVNCTSFDTQDGTVEQIAENPSQSFRYDQSADQYIINADFKSATVGSCWKVKVNLNDGNPLPLESAIFKMQK